MNKVILMGRLTRAPEVRYSSENSNIILAKYTLAVNRRFKREEEPEADFINCVAFGKTGEFAEKYFRKGQMVGVIGRLQVRLWEDNSGKKHYNTDVVIEEQYFAESKSAFNTGRTQYMPKSQAINDDGFYPIDDSMQDEDLPF